MKLSLTVAGTVETFDQEDFKTGLAASLNVTADAISLAVSAASVLVVATIATATEAAAAALASTLQEVLARNSTHALSEIVGVTVESVEEPVITVAVSLAPAPFAPPPPNHALYI